MKKHMKLLLLGWIFTFIGIFNFSSAVILTWSYETVSTTYNWDYCVWNQWKCTLDWLDSIVANWYVWVRFSCSNGTQTRFWNWVITISTMQDYCSSRDSTVNMGAWFDFINYDWNAVVNYTRQVYISPLDNFTPIVSWLTNSVNEFIPYIAYVWIWLLTAIIWFVAIKRLINWVRAKIFSSFKR